MAMFDFLFGADDLQQVDPAAAGYAKRGAEIADQVSGRADGMLERKDRLYNPLEEQYLKDAQSIDSAENQELAAGKAGAAVRSSFDKAAASDARSMAAMGVNPNSGRFASLKKQSSLAKAAAEAGAMTDARQVVKDRGIVMRGGLSQVGNSLETSALNAKLGSASGQQAAASTLTGITGANNSAIDANNKRGMDQLSEVVSIGAGVYGAI